MEPIKHAITIDLAKANNLIPFYQIGQNDNNSHKFVFSIFNNSLIYDLTSLTARIYFTKEDTNDCYLDCVIDDAVNGKMSCLLTTQCLTCPGIVDGEITIYGTGGEILTSITFKFYVKKIIRNDSAIESTSEFTALTTALAQVTDFTNVKNEQVNARQGHANLLENLQAKDAQLADIAANIESSTASNTSKNDIEIIAHRGFASLYPENTLYSARKAINQGANLETDIHFSSDGVMIVCHDSTVDRTTDGTGTISALTSSYISGLDAGSFFSSSYVGLHMPTFTDYLKYTIKAKRIYAELKSYRTTDDITTFVNAIIDAGREDSCTIIGFGYSAILPYIRAISKTIQVGALVSTQTDFNNLLPTVKADCNSIIDIDVSLATAENLQTCIQNNIDVAVWTIDDIDTFQNLIDLGFTKITCNRVLEVTR